MAVIVPPSPNSSTKTPFSISKLISKLKLRRSSKTHQQLQNHIPHDARPPLIPSPLPFVLPEHQQTLSQLGWTTLTFPPHNPSLFPEAPGPHPLQAAYEDLFLAAQAFFDLDDEEKTEWKHKLGSEEGWSKIPGEKEFITLRTLSYTPDILKAPAKRYWDLMGAHISSTLGRISTSLGMDHDSSLGLGRFVGPCKTMGVGEEEKTSTMLRIFRYESWTPKVVAEAHADLGLLSCVVGDVPGLEVWNGCQFVDIERLYEREGKTGAKATMLVGRQLERFSNGRYPAGGHRVVSYGHEIPTLDHHAVTASAGGEHELGNSGGRKYRHSLVFVLRAHEPVPVNSVELETEITGKWMEPIKDVTAGELYEQIRSQYFNINIGHEEREKQRRRVRERKMKEAGKPNGNSAEATR
ncbi:hypothetical protein CC80DRAFT_523159 [Byssothecium circinans]|uniref:Clavaminate synthase-like protein n=1 Tax=Byssothecium circinans TaxID=147558 RepID=A0A6A5U7Q5_9PLEO|nr:hypothetical protein CC80DRAFT_523159 [Byssothecium circinans]